MERGNRWKRVLLALLLSVLATAAAAWCLLKWLTSVDSVIFAIGSALLAYCLFRVLYPMCAKVMPDHAPVGNVLWRIQDQVLSLDGQEIPLSSIRMVHCWPNRDALGHVLDGVVVNIETSGKNHVLRSLTQGPDVEKSVQRLRALVDALGYGSHWPSERM